METITTLALLIFVGTVCLGYNKLIDLTAHWGEQEPQTFSSYYSQLTGVPDNAGT